MDRIVYAVAVPIVSIAISAAVVHFLPTRWVRRVSTGTLAAEAALLVPALLILLTLPRFLNPYRDYGSYDTCATTDGTGLSVVWWLAVASVQRGPVCRDPCRGEWSGGRGGQGRF